MDEIISWYLDRRVFFGVVIGWCAMSWDNLQKVTIEYRFETYGLFLMMFGLGLLIAWWYPIYMESHNAAT